MSTPQFKKASRKAAKIRLGIAGPSGSGKTYTALLLAKGLARGDWNKVGVIDSERGSADLYENLGPYSTMSLTSTTPEDYIAAIEAAEQAGFDVAIIDSITHEWQSLLEISETMQAMNRSMNSYTVWKTLTPRHQKFIDRILKSNIHIITTVRSKTDYIMTMGENGKNKVEKAGMAQVTRDGFEYELTLSFDIDINHVGYVSKDRTGLYTNERPKVLSEEDGARILAWCESGAKAEPSPLERAVQAISGAHTIEEMSAIKAALPHDIVDNALFISAGTKRFGELKAAVPVSLTASVSTATPEVVATAIEAPEKNTPPAVVKRVLKEAVPAYMNDELDKPQVVVDAPAEAKVLSPLDQAIADIKAATTMEQLKAVHDRQPADIAENTRFRNAGQAKQKELKKAAEKV
jgi:hypothetical protein